MERKCDKCLSDQIVGKTYGYYENDKLVEIHLCRLCNNVYETNELLLEFMKEDFGTYPISEISRNMINARKKRSLGESPWMKKSKD